MLHPYSLSAQGATWALRNVLLSRDTFLLLKPQWRLLFLHCANDGNPVFTHPYLTCQEWNWGTLYRCRKTFGTEMFVTSVSDCGRFFCLFLFFFGTTLRVKHLFLLCVHICSFGLWCVWTTVICQRMRIHTSWTGEPVIKTRQICDCHERRESAWGTPLSERDCQRRKCTFLLCLHTLWSFN